MRRPDHNNDKFGPLYVLVRIFTGRDHETPAEYVISNDIATEVQRHTYNLELATVFTAWELMVFTAQILAFSKYDVPRKHYVEHVTVQQVATTTLERTVAILKKKVE